MILAIDPGAERCGFALIDGGRLVTSGLLGTASWEGSVPRKQQDISYQGYRLVLEELTLVYFDMLFNKYKPTMALNEILPPLGMHNATQAYLANCVLTTFHNCAFIHDVPIRQVAANTWQPKIAIRGKSKKITKVQIRNGILNLFPELRPHIAAMKPDETDAIGIGVYGDNFM